DRLDLPPLFPHVPTPSARLSTTPRNRLTPPRGRRSPAPAVGGTSDPTRTPRTAQNPAATGAGPHQGRLTDGVRADQVGVGFYTFVHKKGAHIVVNSSLWFHLVPCAGSSARPNRLICRFVCSFF